MHASNYQHHQACASAKKMAAPQFTDKKTNLFLYVKFWSSLKKFQTVCSRPRCVSNVPFLQHQGMHKGQTYDQAAART
jgi:hypothetical protein